MGYLHTVAASTPSDMYLKINKSGRVLVFFINTLYLLPLLVLNIEIYYTQGVKNQIFNCRIP